MSCVFGGVLEGVVDGLFSCAVSALFVFADQHLDDIVPATRLSIALLWCSSRRAFAVYA